MTAIGWNGKRWTVGFAGALVLLACLTVFPMGARADSLAWNSAWGKGVNGDAGFGICTLAPSCLMGSAGPLGGEMSSPIGVATDHTGNVYVTDNNRVQKFGAAGVWQRAWGKNVTGTGLYGVCGTAAMCAAGTSGHLGGEMSSPRGIATDGAGNVYVADTGNNRIQKFNSFGSWISAWGKGVTGSAFYDVCTVAANCSAGTAGVKGGEMSSPESVATDAAGNVYVADAGNNRIQKFDSSGAWKSAWGRGVAGGAAYGVCTVAANCLTGDPGVLGGEMDSPQAVAADPAGNVYVADTNNRRIQKFDSSGTWERAWGKDVMGAGVSICTSALACLGGGSGSEGGELGDGFYGIAADASGHVFTGEELTNNRVQEFDAAGNWVRAWGKDVNGGGVFGVCSVAASCHAGSIGGLGGEINSAFGVATDAAGGIYVDDADNNRIQKFVLVPDPSPPPTATGPTGQRAGALKKCKKKRSQKKRKKCKKRANLLPV